MEFKKDFDFNKVLHTVFDKLKTDDTADYEKLEHDKNAEEAVEAAMKETYDNTIKMMENANSLEEALAHFSPLRRELIKSTFRCQSFHVDIKHQTDGTVKLLFESISGTKLSFLPSEVTLTASNYKEFDILLASRIVYEIILLCLNFIGVTVGFPDKPTAEVMKIISSALVASDRVIGDIQKMVSNAKVGNKDSVARNLLSVLIDVFAIIGTPIIRVIKILIQDLSWFSIIIIVCQALCFIAITFLSGGIATVAKVVSWLLHAVYFFNKLIQKSEFDAITFPESTGSYADACSIN